MRHRPFTKIGAAIAAATMMFAITPGASAADASDGDSSTLRVAGGSTFDTFNPFNATLAASTDILQLVYDSLVENAAKDNAEAPGLAKSWKVSDDKLTWTYTMQPNATWSDGEPITSADALWTYESIMKNADLQTAFGSNVESIASVAAPDKSTFTITMKEPQAQNPGNVWILPKHVWEKKNAAKYANDKDVVGSGPFVLKKYDKNSGIELDRNEKFWRNQKAGFAKILFIPYKNTDTSVQALKNGEIDYVGGLTAAQFNSLKNDPNITTYAANNRRYYSMAINPGAKDINGKDMGDGNAVLHDKRVRQAIVMAIDNKTLIDKAFGGYGQEATGEVPAVYPLYHWDASDSDLTLAYNPDKAKQLLDEAGLKMGSDGYRTDKEGKPLELRLLVGAEYPNWVQMATYVKPWLKEVGLNVKVITESYSQVSDASSVAKYDMYFTGWGIGADPDWQMSINRCSSRPNADGSGQLSESNWCDSEFDKLYNQQHVEMDQAKRSAIIKQMQQMIYDAAVNDVITYQQALVAYRKDKVTGWVAQPTDGGIYTSQNGYWGYLGAKPVAASAESKSGVAPAVWVGVGIAVVIVIVAVVFLAKRKRANADNEE
ncbi:ABC transporter substrate-binding protein [Bifidobacterium longum]|uniref:ABC transporter substrate-binding protein n=1 Tax=Bifidobacterium longum TaxID=216816 RepID=UPI001F0E4A51|nr:ABC transporter substrate-binding protein [Bifidobacterium longum]MCH4838187.1 ABC transporter substrate-binding protein [Bifidobacterium longum]